MRAPKHHWSDPSVAIFNVIVLCVSSSTVHDITVEVTGPAVGGENFAVVTKRSSPTSPGMVTSTATQDSFYSSMTSECACVCVCVSVCVCVVCVCVRAFVCGVCSV